MSEPQYQSPEQAEAAFYAAFEAGDLAAMMQVWSTEDDVLCVHPGGPRLEGRAAVESSWAQIFAGGGTLRFRVIEARRYQAGDLAVHCVFEEIAYGRRFENLSTVTATNVYRLEPHGWRLLIHHASPPDEVQESDEDEPPPRVH